LRLECCRRADRTRGGQGSPHAEGVPERRLPRGAALDRCGGAPPRGLSFASRGRAIHAIDSTLVHFLPVAA